MVEGNTCCRVKLKNLKIRGSFPGTRSQAQFMRQNLQNILISFFREAKASQISPPRRRHRSRIWNECTNGNKKNFASEVGGIIFDALKRSEIEE